MNEGGNYHPEALGNEHFTPSIPAPQGTYPQAARVGAFRGAAKSASRTGAVYGWPAP